MFQSAVNRARELIRTIPSLRWRTPWIRVILFLAAGGLLLPGTAVSPAGPGPLPEAGGELDPVEAREAGLLLEYETAELARGPASLRKTGFGADPCLIRYLDRLDRYLVLLKGASQVLLCGPDLSVIDRAPTPPSPTTWELAGQELLLVAGDLSPGIEVLKVSPKGFQHLARWGVEGAASLKGLVLAGEDSLFALEGFQGRLIQLELPPGWRSSGAPPKGQRSYPLGRGGHQVLLRGGHLIINQIYDHRILVLPLVRGRPDFEKAARISIQGPYWSVAAEVRDGRLIIAAGGVEDHPLDRSEGEFGYMDSFLYLHRLERSRDGFFTWRKEDRSDPDRFRKLNLSELGIVTPKALLLRPRGEGRLRLWVSGYGGERLGLLGLEGLEPRAIRTWKVMPGVSGLAVARDGGGPVALVSPLLDRASLLDQATGREAALRLPWGRETGRTAESRLGEILFFTTLMAPENRSRGELSRLSCEACHFQGGIDGRVHFSGRDNIHVTTKPLLGLADNVPLFSRAGDESLASMVTAEFRAVNQGRRGRFNLDRGSRPWLAELEGLDGVLEPLDLRRALLTFFLDFNPRPNPWRRGRKGLDPLARQGLAVFRDRCESCHQAVETTRGGGGLDFQDWEDHLGGDRNDLIWGAPFFSKTGIEPYVDPAGTRVPSLRRVWFKHPLFTNGSSPDLGHALARFRFRGNQAWHHLEPGRAPDGAGIKALGPEERAALEALLKYF